MGDIGDAIESTIAALDELHRPIREQRARDFEALRAIVARLDQPFGPVVDESETPIPDRPRERVAPPARRPAERGWGEPEWAPLERARLAREALERGGW